jgi:hypothetical protein
MTNPSLRFASCSMVGIAQLVRALDCDSRGWGFKSPYSPLRKAPETKCFRGFFRLESRKPQICTSSPEIPLRFQNLLAPISGPHFWPPFLAQNSPNRHLSNQVCNSEQQKLLAPVLAHIFAESFSPWLFQANGSAPRPHYGTCRAACARAIQSRQFVERSTDAMQIGQAVADLSSENALSCQDHRNSSRSIDRLCSPSSRVHRRKPYGQQ